MFVDIDSDDYSQQAEAVLSLAGDSVIDVCRWVQTPEEIDEISKYGLEIRGITARSRQDAERCYLM